MDPSLVNWADSYVEILIGGERGVADGVFIGNFSDGPRLGDLEGVLVGDW